MKNLSIPYEVGDEVYTIENNVIHRDVINEIKVVFMEKNEIEITIDSCYRIQGVGNDFSKFKNTFFTDINEARAELKRLKEKDRFEKGVIEKYEEPKTDEEIDAIFDMQINADNKSYKLCAYKENRSEALFTNRSEALFKDKNDIQILNLIIPSMYKGKPITIIGEKAFKKCLNLISATLSNTIKVVESEAFIECENLETLNGTENVDFFQAFALYSCDALETIKVKEGCEIEPMCFPDFCDIDIMDER